MKLQAVIKDVPTYSHFRFDALASRNNLPKQLGSWGNFGVFTYLLFPENIDVKAFETKMTGDVRYIYETYFRSDEYKNGIYPGTDYQNTSYIQQIPENLNPPAVSPMYGFLVLLLYFLS